MLGATHTLCVTFLDCCTQPQTNDMKIIFFGTPEFASRHLEALVQSGMNIVACVTKPDKPQGRNLRLAPPDVKVVSEKLLPHVPIFQPEKCSTPEFAELLRSFDADLFVVVAYGEIIKQHVLDIPKLGCINVHASLLPAYRGAAPMQRALMNGEKETGVSIIRLVLKMDAGDVICKEVLPLNESITLPELEEALCRLGCKALLEAIDKLARGSVCPEKQDESLVTYAEKITPEECQINWRRKAEEVHNLIRAVTPSPGAWCYVLHRGQKKRLKILSSERYRDIHQSPQSMLLLENGGLVVSCMTEGVSLLRVQLEGKQAMTIQELLRGIKPEDLSFEV